jgi:hypothetical protein
MLPNADYKPPGRPPQRVNLRRTHSGFCWAAFTNTRVANVGGDLDRLIWTMVRAVKAWRV